MAKGRIFEGWGSVELRDSDGELIPMDVLEENMPTLEERDIPITLNHTDTIVGRLLDYEFKFNDEKGAKGIWLKFEIYDNYPVDEETGDGIENGTLPELSIGGQYELSENGTATWIAPMTWAVTQKGASQGAKIEKVDGANIKKNGGEGMEDEKKPATDELEAKKEDVVATPPEQKPPEADKDPGTEQPAPFDAKAEHENLAKAVEDQGARLSRIEDMLDALLEEEKKEQGTDAAITQQEEKPADTDSAITFGKEEKSLFAEHSKQLKEANDKMAKLEAQLAKYEHMGVKRTVQSGGSSTPNEMEGTMKEMGLLG